MSTPEIEAEAAQWVQWCADHMREKENEWTGHRYHFAWIDREPTFCTVSNWHMLFANNCELAFPNPAAPCKRILRFSLLGGGQIRTIEHFKANTLNWVELKFPPTWCQKIDLKVTAHSNGTITMAVGQKYRGYRGEMNAEAVVLTKGNQDLAERTAATFRLINDEADNFFALLDGTGGCAICGRSLRDEISKLVGVGPECASHYRIPHNKEAAVQRLALREKLLLPERRVISTDRQ
jgi:hypothetical protein